MLQMQYLQEQAGDGAPPGTGIVALRDHEALASLSLFEHQHIRYREQPTIMFGKLQFASDDPEINSSLLQAAEDFALGAGKKYMLGPMNGSTWQDYRLPLEHEKPMFRGDNTLPASWVPVLRKAGFSEADSYSSCIAELAGPPDPVLPAGLSIRPITPETLSDDLHELYPVCLKAFAKAPYFTPVTEADFMRQYEAARPLLRTNLSYVALFKETPVAFVLAYPDEQDNAVVIKTIARDPDINLPGLIKAVVDTVYRQAFAVGFRKAIHAFMHDRNPSILRSERFGGKPLRRYALFVKSLVHGG